MVQGSGVSVGPGVRAGGLEDGAQWAPRLLVLYNIISNASFTYSIVWTFAMTCCKERPGRTNTKVFLVLCEVQKILKYRYKGSQHLKKVEFYEKLSQTGGGGSPFSYSYSEMVKVVQNGPNGPKMSQIT